MDCLLWAKKMKIFVGCQLKEVKQKQEETYDLFNLYMNIRTVRTSITIFKRGASSGC